MLKNADVRVTSPLPSDIYYQLNHLIKSNSTIYITIPINIRNKPSIAIPLDAPKMASANEPPVHAEKPSITNNDGNPYATTLATKAIDISFFSHLNCFHIIAYFPCGIVQNKHLPKAELRDNPQKQNQERARPLNKLSAIDTILHPQPFYDSLKVKKKQNVSVPSYIPSASTPRERCTRQTIFPNSYGNLIYLMKLYKGYNELYAYNNDGILDYQVEFFVTSWNATFSNGEFDEIIRFFSRVAFLPFTNRGKYVEKCNGKNQQKNLCETNAERGKYIQTIHHLEAIYKTRKKKFLRLWGKNIQEKQGEKEKHWRKKIQTRTGTGKKETPYLTVTRNFCPPSKISFCFFQKEKLYFSISYLFPYFSLSQNTHIFPSFSNAMGFVLKTTGDLPQDLNKITGGELKDNNTSFSFSISFFDITGTDKTKDLNFFDFCFDLGPPEINILHNLAGSLVSIVPTGVAR